MILESIYIRISGNERQGSCGRQLRRVSHHHVQMERTIDNARKDRNSNYLYPEEIERDESNHPDMRYILLKTAKKI